MSELENQRGADDFDPFADDTTPNGRPGRAVAWLALLLALAVAGFNGWQWWQSRAGNDAASEQERARTALRQQQQALDTRIEEVQRRLGGLESEAPELRTSLAALATGLDRLQATLELSRAESGLEQQELEQLQAAIAGLGARVADAETALSAMVVRGESPGKRIELSEVDYLLRTASERLQLFGEYRGARQALELADEQLALLDDPVYLPVRQAIAAVLADLDAVPRVDTVRLAEALAAQQRRIPSLAFPGERAPVVSSAATTGEEPSVWARFKAALSGLVTVRRRVAPGELVSLEDKDYLRQGLWLQLESARLALMRKDEEAYADALARARATLEENFSLSHGAGTTMPDALDRLAARSLRVDWPDISAPWAELRRLREGAAPGARPAAAAGEQAGESEQESTEGSGPG